MLLEAATPPPRAMSLSAPESLGEAAMFRDRASGRRPQVCAKVHIRNTELVALTADLAVEPPASSSSMNRVSAFC
jgi:hypothetical protein